MNPPYASHGDSALDAAGRVNGPSGGGSIAPAANDYDLLPYPSMPIAYTQPAHLAALAVLFGLEPPPVSRARVLELGCASGGNIIPLAARFPDAGFLGIDLSHRHIADGTGRITGSGLRNIRLQHGDLTTLDLAGQTFDYIICHGVFSWVPKAAQEAIFRICQAALTPNGMATISYNVLPGWHLRSAIRDLCLRYAGEKGTPGDRVARARSALSQIAAASKAYGPYTLLMRTEASRLKDVPASYILGEFLAPDNSPCQVGQFINWAAEHGLDYLCETDLLAAVPPTLNAEMRSRVSSFDTGNRSRAEQDIDFLTGRMFRRSVLVRRTPAAHTASADHLQSLHVSSPLRADPGRTTGQETVFTDPQSRPVTVSDPVVTEVLAGLGNAFPNTVSVDALTASFKAIPGAEGRIRQAIFSLVLAGRTTVSVLPAVAGHWDQDIPVAWPIARAEAASGQPWLTTLLHTGIPALPVLRELLPYMDGKHDRAALCVRLADAIQRGAVAVTVPSADETLHPGSEAAHYLEQTLRHLAYHGILMPA